MTHGVPAKFAAVAGRRGYVRIDMRPVTIVRAALACGIALVALLFPWAAAHGGQGSVILKNLSYNPRAVHVNIGDTVTWYHEDSGTPHTVTAHNGEFDSGSKYMHADDTFAISFPKAGTYTYYCRIHGDASDPHCPGMCGEIIVGSPSTPKPAPTSGPVATRRRTSSSSSAASSIETSASASPSPSATPVPVQSPSEIASPIAAPPASTPGNRGALLGIAIGGLAVGASSAGLVLYRSRRARS
jgi:plastocyanin